ncbi:aprataxin and PNK-like factor isoform X2 [Chelmon rostratus]|uniref:aprataxin and PNK-like factor isoform X2 n=1 Tax=Chelmon rostratus TaxID=109905 RepID=UPI001BEBE101|nr:aprataxin and PNK-like factor isoform X2 [Chelmon rostratus]
MSGFDLVPVDGGDPIQLPPGETVLGRGPLLGICDKRVSRLHGLLENLDGQLRLKPTHLNPCFVQSSLTDDPRPLQRDSWHPLHHGDLFSLLPGHFIYKVVAVGGEDRTPRNSQMFEEEELPVSPKSDVESSPRIGQGHGQTPPREEPTPAAPSNQEEADRPNRSLNKRDSAQEVEDERSDVPPSTPKRRVLPAWMMAAVAAPHSSSSSLKVQSALKTSKGPAAASTSTKRAAAKQAKASSPEEAELSEEEMPKKRRRKMHNEEEAAAQSKTDVPSKRPTVQLQSESNRSEVSDESDSFIMDVEEEGRRGETSTADINNTTRACAVSQPENGDRKLKNGQQMTKRAESVGSDGSSASKPAPSKRQLCPYGKDCYRKNPVHFQECSHPGDTDYEEEEEEEETEEADLPECPYGTDCYRKNPLHRKEYKHTKKPASTRRTVPKKAPADDEDEDEEFGDDDSFINDDSEDVGDDSDYVPPDSDESGKEDIKRLQREAKTFLKRRK